METNETNMSPEEMKKHNRKVKAKQFYDANKVRILSRQKALKKEQRSATPWVHKAANARNLAKLGHYLPENFTGEEMNAIRDLYKRAYETDQRVKMILDKGDGGLFQLSNLHLVPKA